MSTKTVNDQRLAGINYALLKEMRALREQVGGDYKIESSEGEMTLDEYIDKLEHGRK